MDVTEACGVMVVVTQSKDKDPPTLLWIHSTYMSMKVELLLPGID